VSGSLIASVFLAITKPPLPAKSKSTRMAFPVGPASLEDVELAEPRLHHQPAR